MNPPPRPLNPDARAAEEHFASTLSRLSPAEVAAGHRLFDRIATPNWALEWGLPRWLGEAFVLPEELIQALVLSNVYGMACARLQDDLLDGQGAADEWNSAVRLTTALNHAWLGQYIRLFDRDSPFWGHLTECIAQWLRSGQPPTREPAPRGDEDRLWLAHGAAPIKLCGVAACLLAQCEALIPPLTAALDRLMTAVTLLDHFQDWADDLAAGRYNAFVAYASPLAQTPENRAANEDAVLREIYLGPAARPYFAAIGSYLQQASDLARPVGCAPLDHHLLTLAQAAEACQQRMAQEAQERLRTAIAQFLL